MGVQVKCSNTAEIGRMVPVALRELHRVLRPGRRAVLLCGQSGALRGALKSDEEKVAAGEGGRVGGGSWEVVSEHKVNIGGLVVELFVLLRRVVVRPSAYKLSHLRPLIA